MSGGAQDWHALGRSDEIADRAATGPVVVAAGGLEIAVFSVDGRLHAIENSCPHAGGPLAAGFVGDGFVDCPWHGWSFDLTTGACRTIAAAPSARVFPLRTRDGVLEIRVASAVEPGC